jgi:hypothetical protein
MAPIVAQHGIARIALVNVLAGVIMLAAGVRRVGRAAITIPWPVLKGFTFGTTADSGSGILRCSRGRPNMSRAITRTAAAVRHACYGDAPE